MGRTGPATAAAGGTGRENRVRRPHLASLVPPADLLSRVEGVEPVLRRGQALQKLGWGAFAISALSALGSVFTSQWWSKIAGTSWGHGVHEWLLAGVVASAVVAALLVGWLRIWVRASRTPFHYTYSIEPFEPIEGTPPQPRLAWLQHDLSTRLTRRIGRLALLDERYSGTTDAPDAHIHIGGVYGIRAKSTGEFVIEVMPWVRLGPTGSPATLAHPVKFLLKGKNELTTERGAASYDKLVERVYFSIATRIYRQIRDDVQRKIDLLPRRYFRAAAYFYEAEDYIRSNTLDAYKQAQKLYGEVIRLYSTNWRDPDSARSAGSVVRLIDWLLAGWSLAWRRRAAWFWPGLGRVELMVARAELGYARTLVYRRAVAGFSGQRLNPIFEARPIAERAVRRLRRLRKDVPGKRKRLFDALVTEASVLAALGSFDDAGKRLREARALHPARAEQNAAFMHVRGQVETRQRSYYFQRAGELLPSFEVSQFERAIETEVLWRRRPTPERNVADMVVADYERVLQLDPGNLSAWANLGYTYWLLDERENARQALERGREYKEIRSETFVAELDYCLARIAAESGDFKRAYSHYVDAIAGHIAQGVWHAPEGYTAHQFVAISDWMLQRFKQYKCTVKQQWRDGRHLPDPAPDGTTRRVRAAVYAFVLNDYGEACLNYWLRTGNNRYFAIAGHQFEAALQTSARARHGAVGRVRSQTRNPVVSFNLNRLRRWEIAQNDPSQLDLARPEHDDRVLAEAEKLLEFRPRDTHIDRALMYEPSWSDGLIEKTWSDMVLARQSRVVATALKQIAQRCRTKAEQLQSSRSRGDDTTSLVDPNDPHQEVFRTKLAGSPTPAPTTDASRAEQKREESRALTLRASDFDELAERLLSAAEDFDKEARTTPEKLLPHEWLRRADSIDWGAPKRHRLERRWERELDVPHVGAIFALCSVEQSQLENAEGRRARRKANKMRERVWEMLMLIRTRFWPDDIDILETCRAFPGRNVGEADDFLMRIHRVVTRWCERDPSHWAFQHLMWVDQQLDLERVGHALDDEAAIAQAKADNVMLLQTMRGDRGVPHSLYAPLGDALRERGHPEGALTSYSMGAKARDGRADAAIPLAIGRLEWERGHYEDAVAQFAGLGGKAGALGGDWRSGLVSELLASDGREPGGYRLLKNWLGQELTKAQARTQGSVDDYWARAAQDAAAAVLHVTRERYIDLVHRPGGGPAEEPLRPIAPAILEVERSFFLSESDEQRPVVEKLLDEDIPDLLSDTADETGLTLPPILLHASTELEPGEYRVHVEGVPVAKGTFTNATDDGSDARRQLLAGLRAAVLRHPDGLPLSPVALDAYPKSTGRSLGQTARIRFAAVLRALAREGVPIDLRTVVQTFAAAPEAETPAIVERARFALRGALPGADFSGRLIALPPELERRIAEIVGFHRGAHFLPASLDDVEAIDDELESALAGVADDSSPVSLVVLKPGLRPFVRELVARRRPQLSVLAFGELPDGSMPLIESLHPAVPAL